jgi:tRNA threonylcarbamoyladenosine biosynthesis protein TsaB
VILLLDSSTPLCKLTLIDGEQRFEYEWEANRQLAKGLLRWLEERLTENGRKWQDLTGIGAFLGPGSFTGLRIGLTVLNTLADALKIPIVGTKGELWHDNAVQRLKSGEDDHIALPFYGSDANITIQRK